MPIVWNTNAGASYGLDTWRRVIIIFTRSVSVGSRVLAMPLLGNAIASHRRLRGKQPAPAQYLLPPAAFQAIADESWHEIIALSADARRKHMHWVHVKTNNPQHRQPDSFTKQQFWEHMVKVYKECYPEPANPTKSILMFGLVAQERHHNSPRPQERDLHNHFAAYCSLQHYWRVVAETSLNKYHVKLHAACHEGYTTMYVYLRNVSPKKPLSEIDPDPYYSPDHPRGDVLQRLLAVGAHADRGQRGRKRRATDQPAGATADEPNLRVRTGDLYQLTAKTGIRTATALRAHAQSLADKGDSRWAEYCTVAGVWLQERIDSAWAVHDAPRTLAASTTTRIDRLLDASQKECTCGGVWIPGVLKVFGGHQMLTCQWPGRQARPGGLHMLAH